MKIIFIRHGKTQGNICRRYIGTTDESLCGEGIRQIRSIGNIYADIVVSSPMKRCIETADIIFGRADIICNDLRECDFGDFENKNYDELKNDESYKKWLESGGVIPFPNGESHEEFCTRCVNGFLKIVDKYKNKTDKKIAFVIHGGSIMAICERLEKPHKTFYERQIDNGGIICFDLEYDDNGYGIALKLSTYCG